MPSAHTHRFSWRPWKPLLAVFVLCAIGLSLIAPLAVSDALAQTVEPPAPAAETPPTVDPATAPDPPPVATADPSLCGPDLGAFARVRCYFFQIIAEVLLLIASLLGRILVFMVDILIAFASYNDFGGTAVVERGWVIVRDMVNMFFIVVLLVSAFATIIGYDEGNFHYKRVLPKLLLMAVLINFSKTLILLLVDFSQVMMLTFVNAFAQAGPGNLVATLQMEKVLSLAPPTAAEGTDALATAQANSGTVDPLNLILSIMLAIFMLSISLGVVTIMVGYLIFRIVGLWVALILSPIALFATALPGRLQKGMDNFTGKYWQRLTALITGGPVMAFFLWLTFAITQNAGEGGLAPALKFEVSNPTVTFLTTVGNSESVASFIVGITLMLMGLDAAVSSATAISETLGGFAKKTAGASKALGKLASTAPFLATYYGARTGARYADRRLDISGKAATAAAATVGQIPILRGALRKPLTEAMTRNKRLDLEEAKGLQAGLEHLTPAQRAIMAGATPASMLATKGQKMAYAQQMMERAGPKNAQAIKDELMPDKIAEFTKQSKLKEKQDELSKAKASGDKEAIKAAESGVADEQRKIKSRAEQEADRDIAKRQGEFMSQAMQTAKSAGDQDMVRSIEEQYKKNPHLNTDKGDMAKTLLADKKALNGMSDQAKGDVELITAILGEGKTLKTDPKTGNVTGFDRAKMTALKDKVTDKGLLSNIEMVEKYVNGQNAAGKTVSRDELKNTMIGKNEKGKVRMFQKGTMAPVMSETAKQAETAFKANPTNIDNIDKMIEQVDAEQVFQNKDPAVWNTYTTATEAELASIKDFEVVEKPHPTKPGETIEVPTKTRSEVDDGLRRFEQSIKKFDDMTEVQQDQFLEIATDQKIPEILVSAKRAGYAGGPRAKVIDSYMEKLIHVEKVVRDTGKSTPQQQKAIDALTKLRAAIEKKENRSFGGAWRVKLEPKEES